MRVDMLRAREADSGVVVAERLRVAHTHWTRLKGLLGTKRLAPGEGLWIKPCRQVHTFGMRYPIDVVFLDDEHRVVGVVSDLLPGRTSPRLIAATSVLELPAGSVTRLGLAEGRRLDISGTLPPGRGVSGDAILSVLCNIALAALWVLFMAVHLAFGRRTGQWATIAPMLVQESLIVVLFLTRRRSIVTSTRLFDWVAGIAGTFLPLTLRAAGSASGLAWLGEGVQVIGLCLAVVAVGSLGRSIGVVAANRGVQTGGLYRWVRHPLYAAHIMGSLGYTTCYPTNRNCLIVVLTVLAMQARAVAEERLLAGDPSYRHYLGRVRWRFVPFVY